MSMFTLGISCLTTSNLPWFMDITFQLPMQYCSLQHQTLFLSLVTSTTGYCFSFGSIPSFFLELILHWSPVTIWAPTDLGSSSFNIFPLSYHFAFSYCSWGSQGKNTEVVCHSLLQWTTFCQTSPPWPAHLGWPHTAWLSFTEFDKAVVRVIRLTSFLWLWFVCLPSDASHNTYRLTLVSLTLDMVYLFMAVQQSAATAPYLGRGVSLHSRPSWPWTWSSSSQPSCARAATTAWMWLPPVFSSGSQSISGSVAQSCPTFCDPTNRSTPGLPVHHQLPEFPQTHVHRVSDAIQPSHPLSSPSLPASNPSQHQSLFQWVNSSHEVTKVLEFQL